MMPQKTQGMPHKLNYLVYFLGLLLLPWLLVSPLFLLRWQAWQRSGITFFEWPMGAITLHNALYVIITLVILGYVYLAPAHQEKKPLTRNHLTLLINIAALNLVFMTIFQFGFWLWTIAGLSKHLTMGQTLMMMQVPMKHHALTFLPLGVLAIGLSIFRVWLKHQKFDNQHRSEITGQFGSADWATEREFKKLNAYDANHGIFIGVDDHKKPLYFPLLNKLTLSPPGGGKTSASSIPVLLSHPGPVFVFDVRGELWAVTARYRAEKLGRQVIVIDPFGVIQGIDFKQGKSESLLKTQGFNPFDWIPENKLARDRVLNALAAAFVVNEGGLAKHFDENAKILIRGYIDYLMTMPPEERGLNLLYQFMSENSEAAKTTFENMVQQGGRAGAAANQIGRVGMDERGSILSTSYRQIDWLGDSNMQAILSKSTFDLRAFLQGNMDIFVVLPEDQVKEHNRLVRLLMALLMGLIVQANPSELPKAKMLFLLEELAQLGYCPDVEQCIEVLRARGVVVWTVFQTLSQIELFEKPDLFKGVPLKQIFTNDDTKTMEWVQTLGGKKTVLTKTFSMNQGNSSRKMQVFSGSISKGKGESIHETGVDLIPLNEIREMPFNQQWIFLHGTKPIRCQKVRYFEHAGFSGRYDKNPLEVR